MSRKLEPRGYTSIPGSGIISRLDSTSTPLQHRVNVALILYVPVHLPKVEMLTDSLGSLSNLLLCDISRSS